MTFSDQLHELGYRLMQPTSLKPKHVDALLAKWREQDISVGTLKNRLSTLRWWAKKINKPSIIARDNSAYGIGKREYVAKKSKAQELDEKKLTEISDPYVRMSIRLQAAFGLLNSAWQKARVRADLPGFRVHDLRHTFGHRLRAAGVGFEGRQDLLGHKSERITTHYSVPDIARLIEAAEKVCERRANTVLRVAAHTILTRSGIQNGSSREDHVQAVEV